MAKHATIALKCGEVSVRSAKDKSVVYTASAAGPLDSADTGEKVYIFDFTALNKPGTYYIETSPGVRSYDFTISEDVYDDAFYLVTRAMYLWRCGIGVHAVHNGVTFTTEACHMDDAYLDMAGGTGNVDATGGWHDAGDYGKYVVNAGITVGIMHMAWQQFGANIKRISLDIPESGKGLPDFLAEIKWETDWLIKMQAPDGSVYHKVSSLSFPGAIMPQDDRIRRYFAPWSSAATADFAAVLACAAKDFLPYDPAVSDRYIKAAERSMAFLEAHPENHNSEQKAFSTGAYDTGDSDDRLWAYSALWDAAGNEKYLKEFEKRAAEIPVKIDADWDWGNIKNLGMLAYLFSGREGKNKELVNSITAGLESCADKICEDASKNSYARPLGGTYYWGCNGTVARQALVLYSANILQPAKKYTDTAEDIISHIFGRNYYCRSYVTGLGYNPPMKIHDRRSMADKIVQPWPGYLAGGGHTATGWRDEESDFTTNEIAINWNSALIYALAGVVYNGADRADVKISENAVAPAAVPEEIIPGLIYDGDTAGYNVSSGSAGNTSKGLADAKNGVSGKALLVSFKGGREEQKALALKRTIKTGKYNYIEFDIKSLSGPVEDIYLGINPGASYDSLLNIKEFTEGGISKKWSKARLPIADMLAAGQVSIGEVMFVTRQKKPISILADNIRLIEYIPPTETVTQTHTATPYVTATPSWSASPTMTATPYVTSTPTFTATASFTDSPTATVTLTPTPETGTKIIIDNSSNNTNTSLLGNAWYTYNDSGDGGTSSVWPEPKNNFEKSGSSRDGKGKAIAMKGKVTSVFQWGYLGVGTALDKDGKSADLNGCAGLRFWFRGDGKTYRVKLVSTHPDLKKGSADNQFGAEFETSGQWQLFEMPLTYFTQEPYWGTVVDQDKALSAVKEIQWQTKGQPFESVELELDGVEIYGCGTKDIK
jgi:endoglucanase